MRLRGRRWMRFREAVRDTQGPLCAICGRRRWQEVDHIDGDAMNNDRANLQGLCLACHDSKTRDQLGYKASGACDATGVPTDPNHFWNT